MKSEIFWEDSGIAGQMMRGMRDRGWTLVSDLTIPPMTEPLDEKADKDKVTVHFNMAIGFRKYGQAKSQEEWNAELQELFQETFGAKPSRHENN